MAADPLNNLMFKGIGALSSASRLGDESDREVALFDADGEMRPLEEIEADVIRAAIRHYGGRMSEVARRLRIGRSTLYRKLDEYEIDRELGD